MTDQTKGSLGVVSLRRLGALRECAGGLAGRIRMTASGSFPQKENSHHVGFCF